MSAFSNTRVQQVQEVMRRLGKRMVNSIKNDVTHDDILRCYVKPEHQEMARLTHSVFGVAGMAAFTYRIFSGDGEGNLSITLNFKQDDLPFSVPNYAGEHGILPDAPRDAIKRIEKWVARRMALGRELGQAWDTFTEVAARCSTPGAAVFLMPCIKGLFELDRNDDSSGFKNFKDRLSRGGMPALPAMSPELMESTDVASKTWARAMLLGFEHETDPSPAVSLVLSSVKSGRNPWGTTQTFL